MHASGVCDDGMWWEYVVRVCGEGMHVVRVCGESMWVRVYGEGIGSGIW